jgi:outer membrane protein assembly factor BamB
LAGDQWLQLQGDLGLLGAVPLTDGIYAAPAVDRRTVYAVDGSGVVHAVCAETLQVRWTFATRGGPGNVNNVSSPAIVGPYLHLGTMAGYYYVLDRESGRVVPSWIVASRSSRRRRSGDERVYFATLGARVYAVEPDGEVAWTWDFVREVVDFDGDRWSGEELARSIAATASPGATTSSARAISA